jgi:hypothetical protein
VSPAAALGLGRRPAATRAARRIRSQRRCRRFNRRHFRKW